MLWAAALLLASLAPAIQTASNLEWRERSVTKLAGATVVITCDIVKENINFVHWYRHQEGEAPKRILYYSFSTSTFTVDSGIEQGKYHASRGVGRSCKILIRNLEESDSVVYYCAVWDMHRGSDFPYPKIKTLLVTAKSSPAPQERGALVSLPGPGRLTLNREKP